MSCDSFIIGTRGRSQWIFKVWWRGGTSGLSDPGSKGWDSSIDSGFLRKSTACAKWGHTCEEPIREQRSVKPNVRLISIFCVCVRVCVWDTNQSESSFHHPDTSEDHQSRPENTTFKRTHLQLTDHQHREHSLRVTSMLQVHPLLSPTCKRIRIWTLY